MVWTHIRQWNSKKVKSCYFKNRWTWGTIYFYTVVKVLKTQRKSGYKYASSVQAIYEKLYGYHLFFKSRYTSKFIYINLKERTNRGQTKLQKELGHKESSCFQLRPAVQMRRTHTAKNIIAVVRSVHHGVHRWLASKGRITCSITTRCLNSSQLAFCSLFIFPPFSPLHSRFLILPDLSSARTAGWFDETLAPWAI